MSDRCEKGVAVDPEGIWYHGSNLQFSLLRSGSTVTQRRSLAEAFSHKPTVLCWEDELLDGDSEPGKGDILHNGRESGWLYQIDEEVVIGRDLYPHPRTTMAPNLEFLTARPLRVRLLGPVPAPSPEKIAASEERIAELLDERGRT